MREFVDYVECILVTASNLINAWNLVIAANLVHTCTLVKAGTLFNRSAHSAGPGKQNDNNGPTERNAIFEGFMLRKPVRAMNGKQRSLEEKSQTLDFGPAPRVL